MKKTNREKDYAVIGELARRIPEVSGQLALSRSARDLLRLADTHPRERAAAWPGVAQVSVTLPLREAHTAIVERARSLLPRVVS
jgi:hypothetical protein